jgi:hypothetical protein
MNDPQAQPHDGDDLDLDAETVTDLEVQDEDAEKVRGGRTHTCACQTAH